MPKRLTFGNTEKIIRRRFRGTGLKPDFVSKTLAHIYMDLHSELLKLMYSIELQEIPSNKKISTIKTQIGNLENARASLTTPGWAQDIEKIVRIVQINTKINVLKVMKKVRENKEFDTRVGEFINTHRGLTDSRKGGTILQIKHLAISEGFKALRADLRKFPSIGWEANPSHVEQMYEAVVKAAWLAMRHRQHIPSRDLGSK